MTDRPNVDTSEVGNSGYSGYAEAVGIERLPELRGENWYRTVREMTEQDATVGAVVFALEMSMRAVQWRAVPADDSDEARKWADFIEGCFNDMPESWPNYVADILSFISYGYSIFETVYKQRNGWSANLSESSHFDDGLIGWRKWAFRPQSTKRTWKSLNGDIVAWVQRVPNSGKDVEIPIERCVVFRSSGRSGQPEGVSLLKRAYRSYANKVETEKSEQIGLRRDLAGLLVMYVPGDVLAATSGKLKEAKDRYQKMIRNVHRGVQEGMALPSELIEGTGGVNAVRAVEAKLLASPGTRQFDTNKIIDRLRTDIAMTVLADFIMVGHQETGTYSTSESKVDFFTRAIGGWLDMIEEDANEQAVSRLLEMNGVPMELWPKWKHDDPGSIDLTTLGSFLSQMETAGLIVGTKEVVKWAHDQAGAPVPSDEELDDEFSKPEPTPPPQPGALPAPGTENPPTPEPTKEPAVPPAKEPAAA
jgi:hypothetical protein